jgi:UDP:flavonoid glycosyltransferase YjiC (YdhE family)
MTQAPIRILIATLGSYGDVQPFFGLAKTLRARGHEIFMIAPAIFGSAARRLGFDFAELGTENEYERVASRADLWRPVRGYRVLGEGIAFGLEPAYRAIVDRYEPDRTVLVSHALVFGARVAQEKLNIPTVTIHLSPVVFRSLLQPAFTPPLPVSPRYPAWRNRLCYALVDALLVDPAFGRPLNAFRRKLGLPKVNGIFRDWVHSPDRVIGLFPEWFAPPAPDWPKQTVLTGFPLYDEADVTPLDEELLRFLDEGEAPILFTSGSTMRHAERFFDSAVKACQILNRRGLLLSPHAAHLPSRLPPGIRPLRYTPFSRLLPRCAAIVHHGGIGTMALALAAGIPQVAVPVAFDHAENGARLERLGVGKTVRASRFNAASGAAALARVLDPRHVATCAALKHRFIGSDPLAETAQWIERTLAEKRAPNSVQPQEAQSAF